MKKAYLFIIIPAILLSIECFKSDNRHNDYLSIINSVKAYNNQSTRKIACRIFHNPHMSYYSPIHNGEYISEGDSAILHTAENGAMYKLCGTRHIHVFVERCTSFKSTGRLGIIQFKNAAVSKFYTVSLRYINSQQGHYRVSVFEITEYPERENYSKKELENPLFSPNFIIIEEDVMIQKLMQ